MKRLTWGTLALLAMVALAAHGALVVSQTGDPEHLDPHTSHHHGEEDRWFNMRVIGSDGDVLLSTWPGEDGTLETRSSDRNITGPLAWDGTDREPVFEPLMDMFEVAPDDLLLRVEGYPIPVVEPELVVLPRNVEAPHVASLPLDAAEEILGNTTPGAQRAFLGMIPIEVVENDGDQVRFRFTLEMQQTYDVARAEGLQVVADPIDEEGTIRFTLSPEGGSFLAHNNCLVVDQAVPWGFYTVQSTTPEHLVLHRYDKEAEYLLQGHTVDIEAEFYGDPPGSEAGEIFEGQQTAIDQRNTED